MADTETAYAGKAEVLNDHLNQRVTRVEHGLEGMRDAIAATQMQLTSLAGDSNAHTLALNEIKGALKELSHDQSASGKANWQTLATWVMVMIVVMSLVFVPVYRYIFAFEKFHEDLNSRVHNQEFINGSNQAKIEDLQRHFDRRERSE